MEPTEKATSTQQVLDAICELHQQEMPATCYSIKELTGLSICKVNDRIKTLVERELIKRVLRGVYVPVEVHPPARSMSKTMLANGWIKIEIGDEVLTLTPREDRMLAMLMQGAATHAAQIETGRSIAELTTAMEMRLARIERQQQDNPTPVIAAQLADTLRTCERMLGAARKSNKDSSAQAEIEM